MLFLFGWQNRINEIYILSFPAPYKEVFDTGSLNDSMKKLHGNSQNGGLRTVSRYSGQEMSNVLSVTI